jgi:tetratricopeptide (TPR) repeat protein
VRDKFDKADMKVSWYQAGLEHLDAKEPSQAIAAFQKVLQADPYCGDAYSGIGHAFLELGELSGAKEAFSKSTQIKPTPSRYVLLGGVLRKLGERRAALDAFQNALRLSPENEEALFNAADIIQEEQPEKAIAMLEKRWRSRPTLSIAI